MFVTFSGSLPECYSPIFLEQMCYSGTKVYNLKNVLPVYFEFFRLDVAFIFVHEYS